MTHLKVTPMNGFVADAEVIFLLLLLLLSLWVLFYSSNIVVAS
jgi:hypothetical protein